MREQEGDLWIDYGETKEEVQRLRSIAADLETNRQSLLSAANSIEQNWQSSNAESFVRIVREEAVSLEEETGRLTELANWLDETADNVKGVIDAAKRRHTERN